MFFDEAKFRSNADVNTRRNLATHIDVLHGMRVVFSDDRFGEIPHYEVGGIEFYLYPVPKEWCMEEGQITFF